MAGANETKYSGETTIRNGNLTINPHTARFAETRLDSDETRLDSDETAYDNAALKIQAEQTIAPSGIVKGASLLNTYLIVSDPIQGGMGKVWRVHHTGWNVDLAMKQPKAELFQSERPISRPRFFRKRMKQLKTELFQSERQKEDFIRECEAWINLGLHPQIVSCYYVREIGGIPSIFAEWMEGGSLKNWIQNGKLYKGDMQAVLERVLDITIQFARGLHYAHENGLVHQDVKPDNLLLSADGEAAKVADFGIARARAALTVKDTNSLADGTIISASGGYTPAYCSMEQLNGNALTRRTDIYSWAVSILEMFLGERLWQSGIVVGQAFDEYISMDMRVIMPDGMKTLLHRCLNENQNERPHDFAEIDKELLSIYQTATGNAYQRELSKAAADTADSLNNRALSFIDLGKPVEAEKCWERGLSITPNHSDSLYNRCSFLLRNQLMSDTEAVQTLDENPSDKSDYYISKLYLAWGDTKNALERLHRAKNVAGETDDIRRAGEQARNMTEKEGGSEAFVKCERIFNNTPNGGSEEDSSVTRVCLSRDGKRMLGGLTNGKVKVWDVDTGVCIRIFTGHVKTVLAVCFSPDGRLAASGGSDGAVKVWDIDAGKCINEFQGFYDPATTLVYCGEISALCFTPDGTKLVIGNNNESIFIWDKNLKGKKAFYCLKEPPSNTNRRDAIAALAAPDNRTIVSCCISGLVQTWDIPRKTRTNAVQIGNPENSHIHAGPLENHSIHHVNFNADASAALFLMNISSFSNALAYWDGKVIRSFTALTSRGSCACLSPDGKRALTNDWGKNVRLWNVATGKCVFTFHTDTTEDVCFGPDGKTVFFDMRLWRIPEHFTYDYNLSAIHTTGKVVSDHAKFSSLADEFKLLLGQKDIANALVKLSDMADIPLLGSSEEYWAAKREVMPYCGKRAVIGYKAKNIMAGQNGVCFSSDMSKGLSFSLGMMKLWDIETGKILHEFGSSASDIGSACLNANGSKAISVCDSYMLWAWDTATGKCIKQLFSNDIIKKVYFSADGSRFFTHNAKDSTTYYYTLKMWNVSTYECMFQSNVISGNGKRVCVSPSCSIIWDGRSDDYKDPFRATRLLNGVAGECMRVVENFYKDTYHICFSPDEKKLLIGSGIGDYQSLELWDIGLWERIWSIKGRGGINDWYVFFSPDGTTLLVADWRMVYIWDALTGEKICEFMGSDSIYNKIESACFSPDGAKLLLGREDGSLRLFDWRTAQCVMEFGGHNKQIDSARFSPDGLKILAVSDNRINVYDIDYDLTFPGWVGWDNGALPYVQNFLALHPDYTDTDFDKLITELQYCGYGWLRPDGVRTKLDELQFGR